MSNSSKSKIIRQKGNYAFIDGQNLNQGVRSFGYRIDYPKFRLYLKNKYNVQKAFMFVGYVKENKWLYEKLERAGFDLVLKDTIQHSRSGKLTVKGNVDAELVLHSAAIEYENYEKAVIVTGDGDFACLVKFLRERKKLLQILVPNAKYSRLFKPFDNMILRIDKIIDALGKK